MFEVICVLVISVCMQCAFEEIAFPSAPFLVFYFTPATSVLLIYCVTCYEKNRPLV